MPTKAKIETLTPEQAARLPEFRDEWFRIGTNTDPADRATTKRMIEKMYAAVGEPAPIFFFLDSPLSAQLAMHLVKNFGGQLRDQLRGQLWGQLGGQLGGQKIEFKDTSFWGQHDAYWIAFYVFCGEIGVQYDQQSSERLGWWADLARSCMWWWPFEGVCFVSERPLIVSMVDGRLDAKAGPAVAFRDGWSNWSIGGVRLDEQIVMRPESQTLDQIRKEPNAEIKRIRIERYGWNRYLEDSGAKVLETRWNAIEAIDEGTMKAPDGETVLVCACPSTGRIYALEVEPGAESCEAAQLWLSGGLSSRIIDAG